VATPRGLREGGRRWEGLDRRGGSRDIFEKRGGRQVAGKFRILLLTHRREKRKDIPASLALLIYSGGEKGKKEGKKNFEKKGSKRCPLTTPISNFGGEKVSPFFHRRRKGGEVKPLHSPPKGEK